MYVQSYYYSKTCFIQAFHPLWFSKCSSLRRCNKYSFDEKTRSLNQFFKIGINNWKEIEIRLCLHCNNKLLVSCCETSCFLLPQASLIIYVRTFPFELAVVYNVALRYRVILKWFWKNTLKMKYDYWFDS